AAIGDLGNRHAEFAADKRRTSLGRVAGPEEAHDARESSVAALDQMKAGLAARATRGFLAGYENAVAFPDEANRARIDAREINGDLERIVGLVHIDRGHALAREGV